MIKKLESLQLYIIALREIKQFQYIKEINYVSSNILHNLFDGRSHQGTQNIHSHFYVQMKFLR